MAMTIRVTPEVLKSKSYAVSNKISQIERELENISKQISASKNYWEGDASNTHQNRYNSMKPELMAAVRDLKAHPRNLLQMAGLYDRTEAELQALSQTLPNDVIQ